jgi:TatA/E family protein of Tat protein translocase
MGIDNPIHLIFLAAVALLVLGPKRLPEVARSLGKGIREFRDAMSDGSAGLGHEHREDAPGESIVGGGGARNGEGPPRREEVQDADVVSADVVSVVDPGETPRQVDPGDAPRQVDPAEPVRSGDAPDRRPL